MNTWRLWFLCLAAFVPWAAAAPPTDYAAADRIFSEYRLDAHVPGLAYAIVADGRLVHVGTLGVQDPESNRPVTADKILIATGGRPATPRIAIG